jgi:tRNA (cmo5U34)-methyltransferase
MSATAPRPQVWDAQSYDAPRRRLIPCFDDFYGTAAYLAAQAGPRVLDLGAGTGLMSSAVLAARPDAALTLLDGSAAMLDQAHRRFADRPVEMIVADLTDPLPAGPFDAVVSALAIHHLSDPDKQDLFRRVAAVLRPGGVFVNAEQVLGPTAELDARYRARHEDQARALGSNDEEWEAALVRMAPDRCATTDDQLAWLRDAGFVNADCWYKAGRFAVLAACRPE